MSPGPSATPTRLANIRWTLSEAIEQLEINPDDTYLNYVAMQLAEREGKSLGQLQGANQQRLGRRGRVAAGRGNARNINLISLLSGSVAVQECLQLEAMRTHFASNANQNGGNQFSDNFNSTQSFSPEIQYVPGNVQVAALEGPKQKSHPWEKMLAEHAGKKAEPSLLSKFVPSDFLFAESRSARRILSTMEMLCSWGDVVSQQFAKKAQSTKIVKTVSRQLMLDKFIEEAGSLMDDAECAVISSDLFFAEGSDITVLLQFKNHNAAISRMNLLLEQERSAFELQGANKANYEISRTEIVRKEHSYMEVPYLELSSQDRSISAFVAELEAGILVRSNSRRALHRVIEVRRSNLQGLGNSAEFAYIRTLMPEDSGADEVFLYLSDPFIRRLVGPELRITEQRRLTCLTHMKMIEYAALLFRSQYGLSPSCLEELTARHCAPGMFNQGRLVCPEGGTYSLTHVHGEQESASCSHHGSASFMTPCLEIPTSNVTVREAQEYKQFVSEYNRYWQTFFDPIGIRFKHDAEANSNSIETVILPLIQNSIYANMAQLVGSIKPSNLEDRSVPASSIFSAAIKFDKNFFQSLAVRDPRSAMYSTLLGAQLKGVDFGELILRGLGDELSFHVFDSEPPFTLDFSQLLALCMGSASGIARSLFANPMIGGGVFFLAALNSPVYVSMPVRDSRIVDKFLSEFEQSLLKVMERDLPIGAETYGYTLPDGSEALCISFTLLAAKFRLHFARIGGRFFVASKQTTLVEICQSYSDDSLQDKINYSEKEVSGHAMVRFRNANWKKILPDSAAAQAEENRQACFGNLTPLSYRAKAGLSVAHLNSRCCPEGGHYYSQSETGQVRCSVHHDKSAPQQPASGKSSKAVSNLRAVTAKLSFLEDGIHAKLIMDLNPET